MNLLCLSFTQNAIQKPLENSNMKFEYANIYVYNSMYGAGYKLEKWKK
jgi:hypothetical protein